MFTILNTAISNINIDYRSVNGINSWGKLASVLLNFVNIVGFSIATVGIAYACVQFILSRGDKTDLQKAKTSLTWAVVAAFITMFAIVAKRIMFNMIGVRSELNNELTDF